MYVSTSIAEARTRLMVVSISFVSRFIKTLRRENIGILLKRSSRMGHLLRGLLV